MQFKLKPTLNLKGTALYWLSIILFVALLFSLTNHSQPDSLHSGKNSLLAAQEEAPDINLGLVLLIVGIVSGAAAAAGAWLRWENGRSWLLYGLMGLTTATGVIHLLLGFNGELLLLLNGLGYLGLMSVLVLPQLEELRHRTAWALIVYTLITIVGYFGLHTLQEIDLLGWGTKGIEVALLVALGLWLRQSERPA